MTRYLVWPLGKENGVVFELRCGEVHPSFDLLLKDDPRPAEDWALVTAWSTDSERLLDSEGTSRQEAVERHLRQVGLPFWSARGERDDGRRAEPSVLVRGISRRDAVLLGSRFGQRAILVGSVGNRAELLVCPEGGREA